MSRRERYSYFGGAAARDGIEPPPPRMAAPRAGDGPWWVVRWRTGREDGMAALRGALAAKGGDLWFPEEEAVTRPRRKHRPVRYLRPAFPGYGFMLGGEACWGALRTHPDLLGVLGPPGEPCALDGGTVARMARTFADDAAPAGGAPAAPLAHGTAVAARGGPFAGVAGRVLLWGPEQSLCEFGGLRTVVRTAALVATAGAALEEVAAGG